MLDPGVVAPDTELVDRAGTRHPLRALVGQPTLLVFLEGDCPVTAEVLPVYAAWRRHEPAVQVLGVSRDDPAGTDRLLGEAGVELLTFYDPDPHPVSRAFRVESIPAAALLVEGRLTWSGEGWDREAAGRLAEQIASLAGEEPILEEAEGLPTSKAGCRLSSPPGEGPRGGRPES